MVVAATSAVSLGKLHYWKLERAKIEALKSARGNFDAQINISENMKSNFHWWFANAALRNRDIFLPATDIELFTDASTVGWAGSLNHKSTGGSWSLEESSLYINVLELKAILFRLQNFSKELGANTSKFFFMITPPQ